jgi:hypothetical protein
VLSWSRGCRNIFFGGNQAMGKNGGEVKIIPSQTIFDTSNTDIHDQPD